MEDETYNTAETMCSPRFVGGKLVWVLLLLTEDNHVLLH